MMKKKIVISIITAIVLILIVAGIAFSRTPRARLLSAVLHFAEQTLEDPEYLMYGVDGMELCRDYVGGDIAVEGRLTLSKLKTLRMSMYSNVSLTRSFGQGRLAADCEVETLVSDVGNVELYAEDETIYLVVPMLDDMSFAFPTGLDLFPRMPDLTGDMDRSWFRENYGNIVTLLGQVEIVKTGDTIVDNDGTVSEEYRISIPQGCGAFIWELLGVEAPDYEVAVSVYLTPRNRLRRVVVDMGEAFPGAVVTLDGVNAGTGIFTYELPGEERVTATAVRSSTHSNWLDITCIYDTNTDMDYVLTAALTWDKSEEGYSMQLRDIQVEYGDETWASGSFRGTVTTLEQASDVFARNAFEPENLEAIGWSELRDNADGFVDDILDQIEEQTGLSLFR